MTNTFYLGVDGGGTGCRVRIEDEQGQCLGQGASGPATLRLGAEEAMRSVQIAANKALIAAGLSPTDFKRTVAGIALAGLGRHGAEAALMALPHPFSSIHCINDGMGAFLGAHSGSDGAIVIAGTGSVGIGYVENKALRVGGYGFPVADEGSGAYVGLRALQLALRAHDGRLPATPLLNNIMAKFNNDPYKVVTWMDQASATDYATLAPIVIEHADKRDDTAQQIVKAAANHIGLMIQTLATQGATRIALLGGLSDMLRPWLPPDIITLLKPADGDAIAGALIHARRST